MSRTRLTFIILVVAILAAAAGFYAQRLDQAPRDPAETGVPEIRPPFALPDLAGRTRHIREWDGRVLLINFWATWCPPCRREMPAFVELQKTYGERGLQIIGVAIDERDKVKAFADEMLVNYPMLVGDQDAVQVAKRYGNHLGALPYSVIVDRDGEITFVRRGELEKAVAEREIRALL